MAKKQNRQQASQVQQATRKRRAESSKASWSFPLNRTNYLVIGIGITLIIIGYVLMATGLSSEAAAVDGKWNNPMAVSVAPVLLVIGYCVIIPYGIIKFFQKKKEVESIES